MYIIPIAIAESFDRSVNFFMLNSLSSSSINSISFANITFVRHRTCFDPREFSGFCENREQFPPLIRYVFSEIFTNVEVPVLYRWFSEPYTFRSDGFLNLTITGCTAFCHVVYSLWHLMKSIPVDSWSVKFICFTKKTLLPNFYVVPYFQV